MRIKKGNVFLFVSGKEQAMAPIMIELKNKAKPPKAIRLFIVAGHGYYGAVPFL